MCPSFISAGLTRSATIFFDSPAPHCTLLAALLLKLTSIVTLSRRELWHRFVDAETVLFRVRAESDTKGEFELFVAQQDWGKQVDTFQIRLRVMLTVSIDYSLCPKAKRRAKYDKSTQAARNHQGQHKSHRRGKAHDRLASSALE